MIFRYLHVFLSRIIKNVNHELKIFISIDLLWMSFGMFH